ncbi:hypothetical protein I6A84_20560 [Frankia sp. CNm7]|uniref:Uncharacterized protein n=1 Tax=Frankia nepalensis TaxID=1836974 RepID=A0A937UU14_9ACTN|nr:hypothetical protein [Frankia nepalensis]MBL7495512.1 hypothetical protein [Frankia nepalensis]MBL7510881.1 hypothetical protein [Frankia nepalensis]MBL7520414.1 hypothetical protein [Frankia nepalensis]MBL7630616.1 hypothetical protein [Frankia nepalensis]
MAESDGQGGLFLLALIVVVGLSVLISGLTRHIRSLWGIAQTFLKPMYAAVKTLVLVAFVLITVLVGLARTSGGDDASAPAAIIVAVSGDSVTTAPLP